MSRWLEKFSELAGLTAETPVPLMRKKADIEADKLAKETSDKVLRTLRKESAVNKFQHNVQRGLYIREAKGEDGPPLAKTIYRMEGGKLVRIVINSVTDGVGGTGENKRYVDETLEDKTEAELGAEEIQKTFGELIVNEPDLFLGEAVDLREIFNKKFKEALIELNKKLTIKRGNLLTRGSFQTTFSAVMAQERGDFKSVQMLWAGDSPIIIVTPGEVVSSTNCEDGSRYLSNFLSSSVANLQTRTFHFKSKTPLVVIACSDGMTKFNGVKSQLDTIVDGTLASLKMSRNSYEFDDNFRNFYSGMSKFDDDTTFSISTLIDSPEDLQELCRGDKKRIIYDGRMFGMACLGEDFA
ncbi:MAG: hypothetical protein ACRCZE_03115 [Candidatus Altimarinota bacterium]